MISYKKNNLQKRHKFSYYFGLLLLIIGINMLISLDYIFADDPVPQGDDTVLMTAICNIWTLVKGQIFSIISAVGISFVGIQIFRGRMEWVTGLTIIFGVIIIVKSESIVQFIVGDSSAKEICKTKKDS